MRTRRKKGGRELMRYRQPDISIKDRLEIIDLFNLSPMKVTDIAEEYGVSRVTIYNWMWKLSEAKNGNI